MSDAASSVTRRLYLVTHPEATHHRTIVSLDDTSHLVRTRRGADDH